MKFVPLRRVSRIVNGGTPKPDEKYWNGNIRWATPVDLGQVNGGRLADTQRTITEAGLREGSAIVPSRSVILSSRAPVGYVAVNDFPTAFNQGCKGLVPEHGLDPRFLSYALQAFRPKLESVSTGTTFLELSTGALAAFSIPCPPLEQQRAIVDFLNRETAQIDAMVDAQECLLQKLEERRSSVTESAVFTSTVNGEVFDSHSWAGALPAHWRVAALGSVCDLIQTGPFGSQLNAGEYEDEGVAVVNPADLRESRIAVAEAKKVRPETAQRLQRHALRAGDVVTARRGALGRSAVVTDEDAGSLCGTGSLLLRPSRGALLAEYLVALLAARKASEALVDISVGTTMDNLNSKIMSRFRIPLPSLPEQRDIVKRLTSELVRTDNIVREATRTIVLMRERREALITAAVTGKVDPEMGIERINPMTEKEAS